MHVRSLRLLNFRAHAASQAEFTPGINLIHGPNGAGKTNVLEAIHYVCLSKSFVTASDSYALRRGEQHFEVETVAEGDRGHQRRIRVAYARGEGKRMFLDGAPLDRLSDVVGIVPVVVYSPEDHVLTAGGPDERRRFLNNIMSQERPVYMEDLVKYRRTLRQRNELLARSGRGTFTSALEPVFMSWTLEYITIATRIVAARRRFVEKFGEFLESAYALLGETVERPSISYRTFDDVQGLNESELADRLRRRVERGEQRERDLGRTLIGPHRDELLFQLNGLDVRRFASHGQHRTFGMALKVAQYLYLKARLEERPLLLLDDVFGILDPGRTETILRLLQSDAVGQSFITATDVAPFDRFVSFASQPHQFIEIVGPSTNGSTMVSSPRIAEDVR